MLGCWSCFARSVENEPFVSFCLLLCLRRLPVQIRPIGRSGRREVACLIEAPGALGRMLGPRSARLVASLVVRLHELDPFSAFGGLPSERRRP